MLNCLIKFPNYRWFFIELFNYCFPADYRLQVQERLNRCSQNHRTIREYVHELESLCNMAGLVSQRERRDRLWQGLDVHIQQELWKQQITPGHDYQKIIRSAEYIEVANRLSDRLEQRQCHDDETSDISDNHPVSADSPNEVGRTQQMSRTQTWAELIAAGKCFICHQPGHIARQCSQNDRVKSDHKSDPPGLTSYHMGVGIDFSGNG